MASYNLVNIGSGNALVPDCTKALPKPSSRGQHVEKYDIFDIVEIYVVRGKLSCFLFMRVFNPV